MRRQRVLELIVVVAVTVVASCGDGGDGSPPTSGSGDVTSNADVSVETVASGLDVPWSVVFVGTSALISERDTGRIVELTGDDRPRDVGVVDGVEPRGEGGLLGIAVRDRSLYAYFTGDDENRIERFELTGAPGSFGLGRAETILGGLPAAGNHNGGRIAFGPDGMLYVTVGDAGDRESAQDRRSLSGKILRLTPDGGVPSDNPFAGSRVYSYGHRNPQGLAWGTDGTLYAAEFGQDTWDELNVIKAGKNYGWPVVEGIAHDARFVDPVQQWAPSDASPSGIAIADGAIWIANLRGERLRRVPLTDLTASTDALVEKYGRLRDVVVAPGGALWVLTNNTDGRGDPGPDDDRILRIR